MSADLREEIDDIEQNLNEILPAVEAGATGIHAAQEALVEILGRFRQHTEELTVFLGALEQERQNRHQAINQSRSRVDEVARELLEHSEGATQHAHEIGKTIAEIQTMVESAMSELLSEIQNSATGLQERADELIDVATQAENATTASSNGFASVIDEWISALREGRSQITDTVQATQSSIRENAEATRVDLLNTINTAYSEITSSVDSQLSQETLEAISAFTTDFSNLTEDLNGALEGLAEQMRERLSSSLENLQSYAKDEIEASLNGSFEKLIDNCVSEFIEELIENVATTQAGVATTSALSPILPAIIVAEKALRFINSLT